MVPEQLHMQVNDSARRGCGCQSQALDGKDGRQVELCNIGGGNGIALDELFIPHRSGSSLHSRHWRANIPEVNGEERLKRGWRDTTSARLY